MSKIPESVCWYEGMAMLPQHFQLQALRHEALAATLAGGANPWFWGVTQLLYDDAALCAGMLRILRLTAVMPDGLPVDYDISRDPPLEFDCQRLLPAAPDSEHTLWLALPPVQRAGQWQPMNERCRTINSAPLPDLASGEFPESISLWQPAPRLVAEADRADLVCLPLLQVVYTEGGFRRNEWFPPSPTIREEDYLTRHARQLCRQAREKSLFLGREIQLARQNQHTADALRLSLSLQSLQSALPLLESLLNGAQTHPRDLFHVLCLFAGQTAILDAERPLPPPPGFDYRNMLPAFAALFGQLESQLGRIHRHYQRLNFTAREKDFMIQPPATLRGGGQAVIGVIMQAASTLSAEQWLRQCIIASEPFLSILRRQRMHGMSIAPVPLDKRGEWETDDAIALFTLTLAPQWFEEKTPLVLSPLHETDSGPQRIMLYRQEEQRDVSDR